MLYHFCNALVFIKFYYLSWNSHNSISKRVICSNMMMKYLSFKINKLEDIEMVWGPDVKILKHLIDRQYGIIWGWRHPYRLWMFSLKEHIRKFGLKKVADLSLWYNRDWTKLYLTLIFSPGKILCPEFFNCFVVDWVIQNFKRYIYFEKGI